MSVEIWVVVVAALAAVGAATILAWMLSEAKRRKAVKDAVPMLMELTGQTEKQVRAEMRQLQKVPG